jgi:phosphate transport system substrate-binding protein
MKSSTVSLGTTGRICPALVLVTLLSLAGLAARADSTPSGLPDYKPSMEVTGLLRSRGNDQMTALMTLWEQGFLKYHAAVRFEDKLQGSGSGMYGIEMRVADMAVMGRPIIPFERYGTYERGWCYPIEIEVATGSASAPHKSPAFAILVHKDNPLAKLTMKQLDGIFGDRRSGGWVALHWDDKAARGADQNIRTWGQLGVQGPLANQPIHVYGPPNRGAGEVSPFEMRVFGGGRIWNEDLREFPDRNAMVAALANDPLGIAYAALGNATPGVKPLAIAEKADGPYVDLNAANVTDRSYPLSRAVYIYYAIDDVKGQIAPTHGDPRVQEFLRYILSKQGQEDVVREGSYLPLTATVVAEQVKKINSREEPPEHSVLD